MRRPGRRRPSCSRLLLRTRPARRRGRRGRRGHVDGQAERIADLRQRGHAERLDGVRQQRAVLGEVGHELHAPVHVDGGHGGQVRRRQAPAHEVERAAARAGQPAGHRERLVEEEQEAAARGRSLADLVLVLGRRRVHVAERDHLDALAVLATTKSSTPSPRTARPSGPRRRRAVGRATPRSRTRAAGRSASCACGAGARSSSEPADSAAASFIGHLEGSGRLMGTRRSPTVKPERHVRSRATDRACRFNPPNRLSLRWITSVQARCAARRTDRLLLARCACSFLPPSCWTVTAFVLQPHEVTRYPSHL